jgi:N-ethylmaleimide reductase
MEFSRLLTPYRSSTLRLPNRIAMAPMTRGRADDVTGVPNPLTAVYYAQRASAGLIITEGIWPTATGKNSPRIPGLVTAEHVEGWRKVTTLVHAAGGRIFAQLWHAGRVSHPQTQPDGQAPPAPSAVAATGRIMIREGWSTMGTPRELTSAEIATTIADYAKAARNAIEAGFDGVEIHGANGYLIHEFLADNTNLRTDAYGRPEQFVLDVIDAVAAEIGADRLALRLSPGNPENGVFEADPAAVYEPLVAKMNHNGLAYLHISEKGDYPAIARLRPLWTGTLIGNFDPETPTSGHMGEQLLTDGHADVVAFGRLFIANPDLPARFATGAPLQTHRRNQIHGGGAEGYIDYPPLALQDAVGP